MEPISLIAYKQNEQSMFLVRTTKRFTVRYLFLLDVYREYLPYKTYMIFIELLSMNIEVVIKNMEIS